MYLCCINPKNAWSWMYRGSVVMLLTHLVEKYPEYVSLALEHPNTYKILDNSLIELGGALSMDRLIAAADCIKADEIILPDVFKNGPATATEARKSIEWLKDKGLLGKYKLMAVCHGNNFNEWEQCFNNLKNMPEIDVIGVPKVTSTWLPERSRECLYKYFKDTEKQIHFLGSWYTLKEITNIEEEVFHKVRSVDTCLPSLYAIQNKHVWEDRDGTIDLEKAYEELTVEKYDAVLLEYEKELDKNIINNFKGVDKQ